MQGADHPKCTHQQAAELARMLRAAAESGLVEFPTTSQPVEIELSPVSKKSATEESSTYWLNRYKKENEALAIALGETDPDSVGPKSS